MIFLSPSEGDGSFLSESIPPPLPRGRCQAHLVEIRGGIVTLNQSNFLEAARGSLGKALHGGVITAVETTF